MQIFDQRFLRFLLVGGAVTLVHFAILITLVEALAVNATVATTAGYLTSAGLNYAANRTFTFRSATGHQIALPRFAAMCLAGATLNGLLMWLNTRAGLHYVPAQIVTTSLVVLFNFTVASRWVFPTVPSAGRGSAE